MRYRGRMTDRNRKLLPDNWSLVRERALTTGLCRDGWYFDSEPSGACRRVELPGRCVKFCLVHQAGEVNDNGGCKITPTSEKNHWLNPPMRMNVCAHVLRTGELL